MAATRVRAEGCSRTGASSELPTSKLRTGRSQINLELSNSLEIHTRTRAHTITGSQSKTNQENRKPLDLLWLYKFKSLGLRSPTWNLSLVPRHRHGPRSASSHCPESWVRLSCLGFSGTSVAMCPNFISPHKTFFLTFRPIYIRTFWTSPAELLARAQSEVIFSLKPMSAFHLTQWERSPPTDSFEKPRECRGFFTAL